MPTRQMRSATGVETGQRLKRAARLASPAKRTVVAVLTGQLLSRGRRSWLRLAGPGGHVLTILSSRIRARGVYVLTACSLVTLISAGVGRQDVPPVPREFRAAWVATVANIDWPSKPGLPVAQQKAELLRIMDEASALKLNALIFQVRPACDALYASRIEPWSEYLTGTAGKAPDPLYDPLQLAVEEAHKRGIELHAWFNPYRAWHPTAKSPIPPNHVSRTRPEIVCRYGKHLWLNPADPRTREYTLSVITDVLQRYDVDGIHLDDYFYPYKERDERGTILDFPDDAAWERYRGTGGTLSRDDWRRDAVNQLIARIYATKQKTKPWVKFGISPFGIWRPGNPSQIRGFDAYSEIYADSRLWLQKGWVDYFTPQLYWAIDPPAQSYPVLLRWWAEQNVLHRHLWPGNFTSRILDGNSNWRSTEILRQIELTRADRGAGGNVHFSMRVLLKNLDGISDKLKAGPYRTHAVPPASPWLTTNRPGRPTVHREGTVVHFRAGSGSKVWLWAIQCQTRGGWETTILPGRSASFDLGSLGRTDLAAVRAIDRCGNESPPAVLAP